MLVLVFTNFCSAVALRKESVDRNIGRDRKLILIIVALRKESVDRNQAADISARR